jgi:hypothetical protein
MKTQRRPVITAVALGVASLAAGAPAAWARKPPGAANAVQGTILRHGRVEMRLEVSPRPALIGPGTSLVAADDSLTGYVQDGRYDVAIAGGRAEGRGPRGPISLALVPRGEHELQVKGLWNGEKVDLVFSDRGISGRLVHHVAGGAKEVQSCRVGVDSRKGPLILGPVTCLGQAVPLFYTIEPAPVLHMHQPGVALLLLSYLSAAPSPPPVG